MMKPKAALVKDGFLPVDASGRGRMSQAMIERCQFLVDHEGYSIEGFAKSGAAGKPAVESAKPEIVRVKSDANRLFDVPDPLRDKRDWTLLVNGKPSKFAGMANICAVCGNSFTYCGCPNPMLNSLDSPTPVPVSFRMKQKGDG